MYIKTEVSLLQIIEGAEENMNRKEYEQTNDYRESVKIIKGFIREMLDGDIEKMRIWISQFLQSISAIALTRICA